MKQETIKRLADLIAEAERVDGAPLYFWAPSRVVAELFKLAYLEDSLLGEQVIRPMVDEINRK